MPTLAEVRSAAITPVVVAFLASARLRQRPASAYRLLQRLDPVHQSPLGVLILSGHAEVAAALRNPALGSDESRADMAQLRIGGLNRLLSANKAPEERAEFLGLFDQLMLFRDPPDHARLRSLVSKAFTPRRVELLEPRIQAIVDELVEPAIAHGGLELMHDFAYPFPARVICELLGVPADGRELFVRHAPALAIALDPSPMRTTEGIQRANVATRELRAYLRELIAVRRSTPANDLLSALIEAESDGSTLSEDELIATVLLLVIAGHETTANVLGNAMHRLLKDESSRRRLAEADDAGMRAAVEEFLRLDGPVQMAERITIEPTTVGNLQVPPGRIVILILAAANRDPLVFDNPNDFDPERAKNPHLSFGAGAHFCVGAPLARLELRIALRTLARRIPHTARATTPAIRRPSFTIAGLQTLDIGW